MKNTDTQKLSQAMRAYAAEQDAHAPRHLKVSQAGTRLEELLTSLWLQQDAKNPVSIKQRDLASELSLSCESIRKACLSLMVSGRWEIVAGTGRTETTFAPLFVESITAQAGN